MSKRRMIHDSFFQSEGVANWTMRQRLLVLGMIAIADDQGRVKGHARWLRAQIFPYDDVTADDIAEDLEAVAVTNDTVFCYESEGRHFVQLVNWWEYQTLQWAKPSDYPSPERWNDKIRQMVYKPKRWVMTVNWPDSEDKTCYEDGNECDESLPNALGNALPIINTNTNTNTDVKSKEKPKKPKRNGTGPLPDIPESLATPDFMNAWGEWRQHRKEIHKKMTPLAAKRLLNKLDAWGPDRAASAINHSITNGWTGIYEDKDRRNGQPSEPAGFAAIREIQEEIANGKS